MNFFNEHTHTPGYTARRSGLSLGTNFYINATCPFISQKALSLAQGDLCKLNHSAHAIDKPLVSETGARGGCLVLRNPTAHWVLECPERQAAQRPLCLSTPPCFERTSCHSCEWRVVGPQTVLQQPSVVRISLHDNQTRPLQLLTQGGWHTATSIEVRGGKKTVG